MAPFQYSGYRNPYVGSIAEMLQEPGKIEADRATRVAEAQARASVASGQAWAGAAQNVGQAASGALMTIADPGRNLAQLKLEEAQRMVAGKKAAAAAMQPVAAQGPDLSPAETQTANPFLDDKGLFDVPKLTKRFAEMGFGDIAPELVKSAEAINDSTMKHQELDLQITALKQKQEDATTVMYGNMADGVQKLRKAGFPIDQAMDMAVQPGLATKRFDPQQFQQLKARLGALPPEQQDAVLTGLMDKAAQLQPKKTIAKDAIETDAYGRTTASNMVPDKPKTEAELAADAANPDSPTHAVSKAGLDLLESAKEGAKGPTSGELKPGRLNGKMVFATFDPKTRRLTYQGKDVTDQLEPPRDPLEAQAAAIAAATAQQSRAQGFAEAQAGRKELTDKIEAPYNDAMEKTDTLRRFIGAAEAGNKVAGSVTPLLATLGIVTSEGVKRINQTEVNAIAGAGSLLDRIKSKVGKVVEGKPIPQDILDDIRGLSKLLEEGARKKYEQGFNQISTRYGLKDERMIPMPESLTPGGNGVALDPGLGALQRR